jgi:hypothetical protein
VYSEDFSSDPAWETDQSEKYYWDSTSESYCAEMVNHSPDYQPSRFAYTEVPLSGQGFRLEWDLTVDRCDWSGAIDFGLMSPDMLMYSYPGSTPIPESTANLVYTVAGEGNILILNCVDSTGEIKGGKSTAEFTIGRLYHNAIEWDPLAQTLTSTTEDSVTGDVIALSVSGVESFSPNMNRVGFSRSPMGFINYSGVNEWAEAHGCVDNISLTASPANVVPEPVSMAFLGSAFVGVVGWRLRSRRRGRPGNDAA